MVISEMRILFLCNNCCYYCGFLGFYDKNREIVNERHQGILCCNKGKIIHEDLELSPIMMHLFISDDAVAKHFRKNKKICQINDGIAMASFQANERITKLTKLLVMFIAELEA